jgi:hypothetical protein
MKVATSIPTVRVENAAKPAQVFRMLLASILTAARQKARQETRRQKARQETRRQKPVKTPRPGHKEPQQTGPCVILVESDIKQDLHGIVP